MRKFLRSRKALSPVIAAIILIAVTVAVSIAVAAWMGALTIGFMGTEQISFTGIYWPASLSHVNMTIKNTGTATLTVSSIKINNLLNTTGTGWTCYSSNTAVTPRSRTLSANEEMVIRIDPSKYSITMHAGDNFAFLVITAKNNQFGPYTASAPS